MKAKGRFPFLIYGLAALVIIVVAALPVISVIIATLVSEAHGCTLHEGFTNPCMAFGADQGETLYAMFVMGWFMLVTLPLGAFALFCLVLGLIIHYLIHRKQRTRSEPLP